MQKNSFLHYFLIIEEGIGFLFFLLTLSETQGFCLQFELILSS